MKTSKEFTTRLKSYLKVISKSDSSVYDAIGMSSQTFYNKVKASNWTLQEYLDISNILGTDKISSYSIFEDMSKNIVSEPSEEYRSIKKDTESVSGGEVDFLRGQILELNAQIRSLTNAINNLTAK